MCGPSCPGQVGGGPGVHRPSPPLRSTDDAARAWTLPEGLLGREIVPR